jgi:hypothetical protein
VFLLMLVPLRLTGRQQVVAPSTWADDVLKHESRPRPG